ncbi:uncharacterized protein ACA1_070040 [Acanthamoeba castellanii str. Neff]|uniref:Uncharacterized protein n=1 Tax=Acanthamoeba castellanii (strain ATCC 30010 / Neff) TaxID=1257118 RepID=L8HF85_ACACF|nr:uncharacterized protein ACA1_070040 [Acanthamoeba castellanii str. Neff]ELR23418.1 hypothetical protein ACA1_070040 [Acanthamoeba castellanii str. Neff]
MRDQSKPLPQLREGDKVLVRRVDTWVEAEVARCANGQVWVRWGSQARWSWRPSRIRSLPWTCAVPCDSAFLRRDLSRLSLTPAQRRSLNKRQAKAQVESDLARETRLQQKYYARKFGTAADAEGCGDDDDDDNKNKDKNNDDNYNNYYSYYSRNSTAYPGENWPDKYRSLSNPHSVSSGGRSTGGRGGGGQYAYALYKGKQYTMAEFEAVLADDRKRAPKTDPLREQIRALREELLTLHVEDPACQHAYDLDQFMFEEAYAASDFSSAGGDDDRGWGAEDDIADGWNQGGRQSGHSEARERAPRRERKPRRAAGWMGDWAVPAPDEADGHPSEETTAGRDDAHLAHEVEDDHHHHHNSRASSTSAAAAASDWANPYDLQFESAAAGGSVSLSASDAFPTSASASLAAFGPTSGGSVSYGMPELTTLAAGFHLHDASRFFTTATSHAFDDNYCAPTYSDSIDFAASAAADYDHNSRYTTADTYGYSNSNDNSNVDHNSSSSSSHHYGNESGEDNDNGAEEEDGEEGDFGGLFSENSTRRESRSSISNELAGARTSTAAKKGSGKAPEAAAAANSGAGGEGGKAGVIDLRQLKRRQKWEARQVKREEFKRRQRQERKLGAAN